MTAFDFGDLPVRAELIESFEQAWLEIATPGTWLTAHQRVEIAERARAAFEGRVPVAASMGAEMCEAVDVLAARPAITSEEWVRRTTDATGELEYVELTGIVARVVAIDTFCRHLGVEPVPFSTPVEGEPTRIAPPDGLRRNRTWVSMDLPLPPFVLGSVPAAQTAMNDVSVPLYMPMEEMGDHDWRRGELHRTQIELVAATVSHVNECFY